MNAPSFSCGLGLILFSCTCSAVTRYVDVNNPAPASPYTDWTSAATTIQDAVDVAIAGDEVVVTNGVYNTGGRSMSLQMTNRLVVDKQITVRSVNGPADTIIEGYQVPGITNGNGAIRCVYLRGRAVLSGFTLTKGATRAVLDSYTQSAGGGVSSDTLSTITNCVLTGNSAYCYGGGAYQAELFNCVVSSNTCLGLPGYYGGGGGAYGGLLSDCIVTGNAANSGAGAYASMVVNCRVDRNSAVCEGGGVSAGSVINCTVTGNSAGLGGGVANATSVRNTILVFNHARSRGDNYDSTTLTHCCTTPLAPGEGNLALDPHLADLSHLSANSPCRGAGGTSYDTDLDGEAWLKPSSIGCDEYYPGLAQGNLSVGIDAAYTNVGTGFQVEFTMQTTGRCAASTWDFGDGTSVSNRPYCSHAWGAPGDYTVTLTAFNDSFPDGVKATVVVRVQPASVHYVALGNPNPVPPFSSWETAAADIQSAIDATTMPGAVVVVGDGTYNTSGRTVFGSMTNRVVVDKPVIIRSLNGPQATSIVGYRMPNTGNGNAAVRCIYLASGAVLSGFTVTNGATRDRGDEFQEQSGGGVWAPSTSALVTNCVLAGNSAKKEGGGAAGGTLANCTLIANSASNGGGANHAWLEWCRVSGNTAATGGGACDAWLNNCLVVSNSSSSYGGGTSASELANCTVVGNVSTAGGAISGGSASNSIVYFNTASTGSTSNYSSAALANCCTVPLPASGNCNFTNLPGFVSETNFHLSDSSACINSGQNSLASGTRDLEGNPRIAGASVDLGAYEFQSPLAGPSYAWLLQYGLPTDGSADLLDSDGDGMQNVQEWISGTDPTDPASRLVFVSISAEQSGATLTWQSVTNRSYSLERASGLLDARSFRTIASGISGGGHTTSFLDVDPPAPGPTAYRVGVHLP